jgi:hypothetical protein
VDERAKAASGAAEAGTDAAGALVGWWLAGPEGAVVGAVMPPLSRLALGAIWDRFSEARLRGAQRVVAEAAAVSGMPEDDLAELANRSDRAAQFAGSAILAGAGTV